LHVAFGAGGEDLDRPPNGHCRRLRLLDGKFGEHIFRIDEHAKVPGLRHQLVQKAEPLWSDLRVHLAVTGGIAARSIEAGYETHRDRIGGKAENDGNCCGSSFCRKRGWSAARGSDYRHPTANQLRG
jgi:hypothetical protein